MILIFCFQSNKHWHEREPRAETSNEKIKLVFQPTDQKHFIHYNQAFLWRVFFSVSLLMHACTTALLVQFCVCAEHVHTLMYYSCSVCALHLRVNMTPECSLLFTFSNHILQSWLQWASLCCHSLCVSSFTVAPVQTYHGEISPSNTQ